MEKLPALQVAIGCAAKLRRDSMGTFLSSRRCKLFFEIAYLPFKLYQNECARRPNPLGKWVCFMQGKAISASLQIATSLSLVASVELQICFTRPQCRLIYCSKEAKDRDKDLQGSRDRRQDHFNDTQISKPHVNHCNLFTPEMVQQTLLLSQNLYSWRRVRSTGSPTDKRGWKEEAAGHCFCFVHFFLSSLPRSTWTEFSLHEVL